MRKVFWCCLAAGVTVCCAFWAAAYLSQKPDSSFAQVALLATRGSSEPSPQVGSAKGGTIEADELIPADPVPIDDAPPKPTPGWHIPPEIAGMLTPPPIVIHDQEDLTQFPNPSTKNQAKPASPLDGNNIRPTVVTVAGSSRETGDVSESLKPRAPLVMPYCKETVAPAPIMPYCAEDEAVPNMPPAPIEDMERVSRAAHPNFDVLAFWMGFFSGPGQVSYEPTYTVDKPGSPGAEESSEPPASHGRKQVDPIDLFSHSRRLQMPRPAETESDTMEMRPSDWKPYSLDPGPF
jgi:hypothetical protein